MATDPEKLLARLAEVSDELVKEFGDSNRVGRAFLVHGMSLLEPNHPYSIWCSLRMADLCNGRWVPENYHSFINEYRK